MKQIFFLLMMLLFATSWNSYCQNAIDFTYDAAGNRKTRTLHVGAKKGSSSLSDENKSIKEAFNDDVFTPEIFRFYPNPTKGTLEVEAPSNSENIQAYTIIITDVNGRIVLNKKVEPGRTMVDLSGQQDGIYILKLINGQRTSVWKIIKN